MYWKKSAYWLKGGIIGGGLAALSGGILYVCLQNATGYGLGCVYFMGFILFPITWVSNPESPFQDVYFDSLLSSFVGSIIVWLVIGAVVGILLDAFLQKKKGSPVEGNPFAKN